MSKKCNYVVKKLDPDSITWRRGKH